MAGSRSSAGTAGTRRFGGAIAPAGFLGGWGRPGGGPGRGGAGARGGAGGPARARARAVLAPSHTRGPGAAVLSPAPLSRDRGRGEDGDRGLPLGDRHQAAAWVRRAQSAAAALDRPRRPAGPGAAAGNP